MLCTAACMVLCIAGATVHNANVNLCIAGLALCNACGEFM